MPEILKASAAYAPLAPAYSMDRLAFIWSHCPSSSARVVVELCLASPPSSRQQQDSQGYNLAHRVGGVATACTSRQNGATSGRGKSAAATSNRSTSSAVTMRPTRRKRP
jgi:hypothetical protein